jgi:hypothetical protein|tara:strand:+ start:105 stop:464 length:360 start_codon:yes stop_codon:yes gene_type:complete
MKPISYKIVTIPITDLKLGYHGSHTDFVWRPYHERSEEARADYDLLEQSIIKYGVKKPVITFKNHVLIGMRRIELLLKHHGIFEEIACAEITEDVYLWDRNDIPRLDELKKEIGEFIYK